MDILSQLRKVLSAIFCSILLLIPYNSFAQPGTVLSHQKISDTQGGFTGILDNDDIFGHGVANIGDIDGDGVDDLAIGAQHDDDGASNSGAVYILFMNTDGTVKSDQKISNTQGGFANILAGNDNFGNSITGLGDLDNDGIPDIAIGNAFKDDGGTNRGVVWIMFLNSNGTVKSFQRISDTQGNFTGVLNDNDRFGTSVACIGDLDGDGIADIAVGASLDDDGGTDRGAVWILHLNSNGTVKFHEKISNQFGNFAGALANGDRFSEVATLGDLDGDGIVDIAVGSTLDDDGGSGTGAVWILFLNSDGSVKGHQKISATSGGFTGLLDAGDRFAFPSNIGDLDGDQITDIAVGTFFDDDGGTNRGAVWILFMNSDGTVKAHQKISSTEGNFTGTISNGDLFGLPVAGIGDLNGDGTPDLLVGARQNDDGGTDRGAAWVLFLSDTVCVNATAFIVDAGGCKTVFLGYQPEECTDLAAIVIGGGTTPFTYSWNTGETTQEITVCPSITTTFSVTVTDATGCAFSGVVDVHAIDVRCGNNNDKVQICHFPPGNSGNMQNICISSNAVLAHLSNHGDQLGVCNSIDPCLIAKTNGSQTTTSKEMQRPNILIQAYPNPFNNKTTIEFSVPETKLVALHIYDVSGEKVAALYEGEAEQGKVYAVELDSENLSGGIYFYVLFDGSESHTGKLVVIKR